MLTESTLKNITIIVLGLLALLMLIDRIVRAYREDKKQEKISAEHTAQLKEAMITVMPVSTVIAILQAVVKGGEFVKVITPDPIDHAIESGQEAAQAVLDDIADDPKPNEDGETTGFIDLDASRGDEIKLNAVLTKRFKPDDKDVA